MKKHSRSRIPKLRIDEMKEDTALLPEMFRNEGDEKQRIKTEYE